MKLDKEDALLLSKALTHVDDNFCFSDVNHDQLEELAARIDDFLVSGCDAEDCVECCEDDEEGCCCEQEERCDQDEEEDEQVEEEDDEEDEETSDSSGRSVIEHEYDTEVEATTLHNLIPVNSPRGILEFEYVDDASDSDDDGDETEVSPRVDFLIDGYRELENVSVICNEGGALRVTNVYGDAMVINGVSLPETWTRVLGEEQVVSINLD